MTWHTLPVEIHGTIYSYCDRESWKSLRLTCKSSCSSVTPVLFSTIHLSPNTRSFDRARHIAESPGLVKHVKEVVYHVGVLEDVHNGFPAFRDDIMRLHKPIGSTDDIIADILWKYNCFLEEIQGQSDFSSQNQSQELATICQPMSSLESIVTILDSVDPFDLPEDYIGRRTGVHAVCSAEGPHFAYLYGAAAGKRLTKITGLSMSWLSLSGVADNNMETVNLRSVQELVIGLDNSEFCAMDVKSRKRCLEALDKFLRACITSERYYLSLDFDELPFESGAGDLVQISEVVFRHYWPKLVRLELMGIVATEDAIVRFLVKHELSLKSLYLDDIEITAGTSLDANGNETKIHGSVLSLFHRIHESLRLDEATISGNFTNRVTEAWYVDLEESGSPCFRNEIEHWLAHKGQSPFPAAITLGTTDQINNGSVEDYSDSSWVWADELLDRDE